MAANPKTNQKQASARLFWIGRSQAVRLPKGFLIEGDRVRIRRMGAGVLLEPSIEPPKESIKELFARKDAMKGDPILPDGAIRGLLRFVSISSEQNWNQAGGGFLDEPKFD